MKRSQINSAIADARLAFERHQWHLPPRPRWDVTGFGLNDFKRFGLVLVNLSDLPEYCEKLMFARAGQMTLLHCHKRKQEDIICRAGTFAIRVVARNNQFKPNRNGSAVKIKMNGDDKSVPSAVVLYVRQGERITIFPGTYHEFWPVSEYCILGEVSTANDDVNDNFFENPDVGRFEQIEEDEAVMERLVNES